MGGCRCSYKNCTNTTKTRENLHFFHYPVKQKERCRQWIENAHKIQFYDLDEDQLRNKVICETHFEDRFFPNMQKKRLLQGAIPTLEGDCEPPRRDDAALKIHDVQVLPANADGTIFVLETNNMQNSFQSEKIESYIYTNNGLVLPINKCEASSNSVQNLYNDEEETIITKKRKIEPEMFTLNSASDSISIDREFDHFIHERDVTDEPIEIAHVDIPEFKPMKKPSHQLPDDIFSKTVGNKYVKKIKQHSKDIALLKRILKTRASIGKPNNTTILNILKRQLPPSLLNVVTFNLNRTSHSVPENLEFFSTIHQTSPEVYEILSKKYNWKLPNPESFSGNKNNGLVHK